MGGACGRDASLPRCQRLWAGAHNARVAVACAGGDSSDSRRGAARGRSRQVLAVGQRSVGFRSDGCARADSRGLPRAETRRGGRRMTRLGSPWFLALAILVIARIALVIYDRRRRTGAFTFSSFSLLAPARGLRTRTALLPFALEVIALLLFVVAMARPQRVTRMAAADRYGIDIVVALDSSGSMAAEDFRPRNRFSVAKELIGDFISRRQDDRIGIVTFGVRAATRVPITYDREIAQTILDRAQVGENGDGTAIGHAIATAVNRLRTSKTRTRVIILVTDGVNNAGSIEPMTAANIASKYGIKIYTIGVGSRGAVS